MFPSEVSSGVNVLPRYCTQSITRGSVAHTAATVGSHTDNTAFFDRKYIAVDLKLSFAFEEEIEFLVIFVGV